MSTAPVIESQEKELQHEALTIVESAKAIVIHDQESYDDASKLLLEVIMPFRKRWLSYWSPLRETAYSSYKKILDKFNEGDKPAEQAEKHVKQAIRDWDSEQARIQQERQREAQRKAEADEAARRLEESVFAEESGAVEEAEAIMSAPSTAVAAPVEPTYQRAAGVSSRENWKARVTDMKALCKAIAKGDVPDTYVEANMSTLNARAKADKQTLKIPGVQAYNEPIIAGRSRS